MNPVYPLPDESQDSGANPAAELIRQKIDKLYGQEPSLADPAVGAMVATGHSKHQEFIARLIKNGGSVAEIQTQWHDYYGGLSDDEKHEVWREFYSAHTKASRAAIMAPGAVAYPDQPGAHTPPPSSFDPAREGRRKSQLIRHESKLSVPTHRATFRPIRRFNLDPKLRSALFGLGVGFAVLAVALFGLFNERIVAPFVTPSRALTNTPIISTNAAVGPEPKVIVPKINLEVPVVYDEPSIDEGAVQAALERGVVHYATTANPGEKGNVAIVGHSSNNIFNRGRYKFAFVMLNKLEKDDIFMLHKDGKRYTYRIYEKRVITPEQVEILLPQDKHSTATLITCDPPGSSAKRLAVIAEQISPDPLNNVATNPQVATAQPKIVPGNAPSLWSRLFGWL